MIPLARWTAGVAAVLLLTAGCGDDATTGEVSGLDARLDAVDAAVASHDYDTARTAVASLEHAVEDARRSGDLDRSRAEEILGAAETLRQALPDAAPTTTDTTPSQSPTPTPESEPESTPAPPPAPPGKEKKPKPAKPKPEKHEPHGHGEGHGHED